MSLPITPEAIIAAYEYLRTTPPFSTWRLPHADAIEFHVTRHHDREADYTLHTVRGVMVRQGIHISAHHIKTTAALLEAVGHEMIHQHQAQIGKPIAHTMQFNRWNRRMCETHGWAVTTFE